MHENAISLAASLGEALLSRHWSITTAESCTGGGISYAITSTPGSSAWLNQAFITYSNEAKTELVGVEFAALQSCGAVSEVVVRQMAKGATLAANADVAIAVSGIAGPDGGSDEKPVGTVWFGFCINTKLYSVEKRFTGDRHQVRKQTIDFALSHCLYLIDQ